MTDARRWRQVPSFGLKLDALLSETTLCRQTMPMVGMQLNAAALILIMDLVRLLFDELIYFPHV